jgi:hypothetical protein
LTLKFCGSNSSILFIACAGMRRSVSLNHIKGLIPFSLQVPGNEYIMLHWRRVPKDHQMPFKPARLYRDFFQTMMVIEKTNDDHWF